MEKMEQAESLSLLSHAPVSLGFDNDGYVPATPSRVTALARVLAAGNYLGYLNVLRRRVSKGQAVTRSPGASHLKLVPDADLDKILHDFDTRSMHLGARWHPFIEYWPESPSRSEDMLRAFANSDGLQASAIWGAVPVDLQKIRWSVRHTTLTSRARHPDVASVGLDLGTGPYVASAYVLARVLSRTLENATVRAVEGSGFVMLEPSTLLDRIEEVLLSEGDAPVSVLSSSLPSSALEALNRMTNVDLSVRRMLGAAVRTMPQGFMVDLVALTKILHFGLLIDKSGGKAVNVLGMAFEPYVQQLIDAALPGLERSPVRALTGRTLTLGGVSVTDVDAVAQVKDVVILVSCKAFENTVETQAGSYAAVRLVDTRLRKALDEWAARIAFIRANPLGDNYDLRNKSVIGIVVTPQFLFTGHPAAHKKVLAGPSLFTYMATAELERALNGLGNSIP